MPEAPTTLALPKIGHFLQGRRQAFAHRQGGGGGSPDGMIDRAGRAQQIAVDLADGPNAEPDRKTERTMAMTKKASKPTKAIKTKQMFSYRAPTAMSVLLAGDFTHWQSEAIPMKRGKDGLWKATAELDPGVHHYRFLVDGQWQDDPECELRVPNPYGGHNSVRNVG
jgi:hypothetical protein